MEGREAELRNIITPNLPTDLQNVILTLRFFFNTRNLTPLSSQLLVLYVTLNDDLCTRYMLDISWTRGLSYRLNRGCLANGNCLQCRLH